MAAYEIDGKRQGEEGEFNPLSTPYDIDKETFPFGESLSKQLTHLLKYAILAPSSHNTQPWKFQLFETGIAVFADYTRRLPVSDPNNRELLMGVGAALMNLRVAARHFGFECHTEYNFSGDSELPIAFVSLHPTTPRATAIEELDKLFYSIAKRHTNRHPFLHARVPEVLMARLKKIGSRTEASMILSTDPRLNGDVASLVAYAEQQLQADPAFRREMGEWLRPNSTQKGDGIPGSALGISDISSTLAPWAVKNINMGAFQARMDKHLCAEAPALGVLYSEDSVPAWLAVGEVLEEVLLSLTRDGLQFSFFNMPIEIPEARLALRDMLGLKLWPQLLLRIGYSLEKPVPSPRRPVEECLMYSGQF